MESTDTVETTGETNSEDSEHVTSSEVESSIAASPTSSTDFESSSDANGSSLDPNMDVNDIEINVVDHVDDPIYHDDTLGTVGYVIAGAENAAPTYYHPLSPTDRFYICKYLGISCRVDNAFICKGRGNQCTQEGLKVFHSSPDGACLFHSLSYLLTKRENYDLLIRKVLCDYIGNPENWHRIRPHVPRTFRSGKHYLNSTNMKNSEVWGTDVEILSFAQMVQTDVVVFTKGKWQRFPASGTQQALSANAFYLVNVTGDHHYDPVISMG